MRNVIVNGGSRGLGLGIVRTLQAAGYNVIAIARRNTQDLSRLARERASGPSGVVHCKSFDLCDVRGIPRLVKSLRSEFGAMYGLVNNAGIGTEGLLARHARCADRKGRAPEHRIAGDSDQARRAIHDGGRRRTHRKHCVNRQLHGLSCAFRLRSD